MATQGLVTVRKGGRVLVKVVAGCEGYNARKLAARLRARWPMTLASVQKAASEVHFGCEDCLVVMGRSSVRFAGDDDLGPRYRETFDKPRLNPRWKHGTAAHTVVINL